VPIASRRISGKKKQKKNLKKGRPQEEKGTVLGSRRIVEKSGTGSSSSSRKKQQKKVKERRSGIEFQKGHTVEKRTTRMACREGLLHTLLVHSGRRFWGEGGFGGALIKQKSRRGRRGLARRDSGRSA